MYEMTTNYERGNAKFFVTLNGIIEGIYCDLSVNKNEILFLDTWLLEIADTIPLNNEAKYIYSQAKGLTEYFLTLDENKIDDNILDKTLERLEKIQDEILVYSGDVVNKSYFHHEYMMNFTQGLCKGLMADGVIANEEIECLVNFFNEFSAFRKDIFLSKFYELFDEVDIYNLSGNERDKIKCLISDYSGSDVESGSVDGLSLGSSFFDYVDDVDLNGKFVQFTGRFSYGTRAKCKELAEQQGAIVCNYWRNNLDYLIVGEQSSRDWIYQSYGRKIEKAREYQGVGYNVKIITENQWIK